MRAGRFVSRRSRPRPSRSQTRRGCAVLTGHLVVRHVPELRRPGRSISCSRARVTKMKFKIKFPKLKKRTKLRATAVRRPLRAATAAEYEELAEPNMKLSRALLIVLILHVVA